jgi:hypothetical protein
VETLNIQKQLNLRDEREFVDPAALIEEFLERDLEIRFNMMNPTRNALPVVCI